MVESQVKVVCVTGAAGQIGYSILPMVASGRVFGPNTQIHLKLLDITPCLGSLNGVKMELDDCAFPLLTQTDISDDPRVAFKDCDLVICVGGFPRKAGMERSELMAKNAAIFKQQGEAANDVCTDKTKFLVVANPANTNAFLLSHFASKLPKKNFTAMTRLDHNRSKAQIALKTGKMAKDVKNVIIWGNHSSTQFPDTRHGTVSGQSIREALNDDAYLDDEFIKVVSKRGAAIIEARKLSSAMSAANAAVEHCYDWIHGTAQGEFVSMAVISNGEYGVEAGLCYSYPCRTNGFEWEVVTGLNIDSFSEQKMKATEQELKEERAEALA